MSIFREFNRRQNCIFSLRFPSVAPPSGTAANEEEPGLDDEDEDPESRINEDEFFSAVSESTSKICIHNMKIAKDLLSKGNMATLLRVLGGLALVRNKLWHYNEHLMLQGQPR